MALPRFVVPAPELVGSEAVLVGRERHHLHVRRLRVGSAVMLTDGAGRERQGTVMRVERDRAVVRFIDTTIQSRESPLDITLAQAVVRPAKLDWIVEKSTELGVGAIALWTSERTQFTVSDQRIKRLQRIAEGAAKQCERNRVPRVSGPAGFADVSRLHGLRLLFSERDGQPLARMQLSADRPNAVLVVIGPEGGLTAAEHEQAQSAGMQLVGLGPRILRSETAAVVAIALCQFLWGDVCAASR